MCLAIQNAVKATWHQSYVFEIHPADHELTLTTIQDVGQTLASRRNLPSAPHGSGRLPTQERRELEEIGGKQVVLDSIYDKGWDWKRYSDGVNIIDGALVTPISGLNERLPLQYYINKVTFVEVVSS